MNFMPFLLNMSSRLLFSNGRISSAVIKWYFRTSGRSLPCCLSKTCCLTDSLFKVPAWKTFLSPFLFLIDPNARLSQIKQTNQIKQFSLLAFYNSDNWSWSHVCECPACRCQVAVYQSCICTTTVALSLKSSAFKKKNRRRLPCKKQVTVSLSTSLSTAVGKFLTLTAFLTLILVYWCPGWSRISLCLAVTSRKICKALRGFSFLAAMSWQLERFVQWKQSAAFF